MTPPARGDAPSVRPEAGESRPPGWPLGAGLALVLTLTLVVGLQLGAMPWQFRKQMWQLQGAFAGGVAGTLRVGGA
ncbi:MAG: hypothetical protein ER33_10750 [Cyanobium sp. CACIAM 14]|nr:MAG: hypothetical protein ER33_10750 [Cyanobium sp. CACIAM 14]